MISISFEFNPETNQFSALLVKQESDLKFRVKTVHGRNVNDLFTNIAHANQSGGWQTAEMEDYED